MYCTVYWALGTGTVAGKVAAIAGFSTETCSTEKLRVLAINIELLCIHWF